MRHTDFARATLNVATIAIATLVLGGCLEQKDEQNAGFTGANQPPPNAAPTISGNPAAAVTIGEMYSFLPNASDPDGDSLTFSIQNKPGWASFSTGSGEISGRPTLGDVGNHGNIRISVSDGKATASLSPFSINVMQDSNGNSAPSISGMPPTSATVGVTYSFAPTATDPDNDTLNFMITGQPAWANFNMTTGQLSGTPIAENAGVYPNIVISVSDGELTDSLPSFTITVTSPAPANTPPTISGNPPGQVDAGSSYSFTPTADDADGDTLTFTISNQPAWASFSATTGTLSGTPGDANVGDFNNITITVSDGQADDTLGPFSIAVNPVTLGSVTLSWTPPTENDDGTPLTDLAGYKIYWGTAPGSYPNSLTLDNPGLSSYVVDNLAPGTYTFVATSFNDARVESVYSNPLTRVVN